MTTKSIALIRTSSKLDASTLKLVNKHLTSLSKQNLSIEQVVEPSLIAGFVIEVGGKEYDYSIKGSLAKLQAQLS